jgi:hypothetical protein
MATIQFNNLKSFFEKMFFKISYVFFISADDTIIFNHDCNLSTISFERIGKDNFLDLENIFPKGYSREFFKMLEKRIDNPEMWLGYLARIGGNPVGCFWLLTPKNIVLYDNIWIDTKSILLCGARINQYYLGKRIFNQMQLFSFNILKKDFPTKKMILIVEKSNIQSIKSILRSNLKIHGMNYLIKMFGKNCISIYIPQHGSLNIWLVFTWLWDNRPYSQFEPITDIISFKKN